MKPRLTKQQGYWWCKGRNRSGIAKSPKTAYENWKRQLGEYNESISTQRDNEEAQ